MTTALLIALAVIWLAWSNGANDNFKGVATLWGSRTATYRRALIWATAATILGSVVSIAIAGALVKTFSGAGLVGSETATRPALLLSVAAAAAVTVILATFLGMPTSTTHALTGGLVGASLVAVGPRGIDWTLLLQKFAQPLLLSPVLAIGGTAIVYLLLRRLRLRLGIERHTCLCVGAGPPTPLPAAASAARSRSGDRRGFALAPAGACVERYDGQVVGIRAQTAVDVTHFASAGAVCFARAVNDTPKIAALLLASSAVAGGGKLAVVAIAMAAGGWIQSRRVAQTMSRRITDLNPGQGLTANLVTAALVLGASRLGVPVSTTHVSCGSIFGIGLVNRRRSWTTIAEILATWVITLPLALGLGALICWGAIAMGRA